MDKKQHVTRESKWDAEGENMILSILWDTTNMTTLFWLSNGKLQNAGMVGTTKTQIQFIDYIVIIFSNLALFIYYFYCVSTLLFTAPIHQRTESPLEFRNRRRGMMSLSLQFQCLYNERLQNSYFAFTSPHLHFCLTLVITRSEEKLDPS